MTRFDPSYIDDINELDAYDLRRLTALALSDATMRPYQGFMLDRLASISGRRLPELLRELADDVESIRTGTERPCHWDDLDAASGTCRNCGLAFHAEPDPTAAVERHYSERSPR